MVVMQGAAMLATVNYLGYLIGALAGIFVPAVASSLLFVIATSAMLARLHRGAQHRIPTAVLVAMIRDVTRLPVIAAGGLATPAQVAAVVHSGAHAIMAGTVLLRTSESGATPVHQAAIADHSRGETVLTRSFTGRPARALRNRFIDRYNAIAPPGYPAVHHLTSPIRKAAAAASDPEAVHLRPTTGLKWK